MRTAGERRAGAAPFELEEFGKRLKSIRRKKGLTQKDLAALISVSDKTISKWETGNSLPDIVSLKRMARVFDCTIDYLVR